MTRKISHSPVVFISNIRVKLPMGLIAGFLSAVVGMSHVGGALSETNAENRWINPDKAANSINIPTDSTSPIIAAHAPVTLSRLSWALLERMMTLPLIPRDNFSIFQNIDDLLQTGQLRSANKLLEYFNKQALNRSQNALRQLLVIKTLYLKEDYSQAIRALTQLRSQDLSLHNQTVALWLNIGSLLGIQKIHEALKMSARLKAIGDKHTTLSIYNMIWNTLRSMHPSSLNELEISVTDTYSAAWLELAKLFVLEPNISQDFSSQLLTWRRNNPEHPARAHLIPYIATQPDSTYGPHQRVALLLPMSSSFLEAASSIQDGFLLLSKEGHPSQRPLIQLYDFGDQTELVGAYYDAAVRDGSDFIIGPIGTAAVKELARRDEFPIPTLVFGTFGHPNTPILNAYQFSLAPEHDAVSLAQRAFDDGQRRAVALYPNTSQGRRIFTALQQEWEKVGGALVQSRAYDTTISDHSRILKALFHLDHSDARRTALQRTLGDTVKLKFSSRRRQDIDALFLLSNIKQARLIKPQIDFHHAHDLTVYSLNNDYTGISDPMKDLDLEGIIFGDMPWIVSQEEKMQVLRDRMSPEQSQKLGMLDRLFAMGLDAYQLIKYIPFMQNNPNFLYQGVTGKLSINKSGRVLRREEWFLMQDAKPVHLRLATLAPPPRLDGLNPNE